MIAVLIFMGCSQVCRAIHNTLWQHYQQSKFSKLNPYFWNEFYFAWQNKYVDRWPSKGRKKWFWKINIPVQISSGWHIFNTVEIIFHWIPILVVSKYSLNINTFLDFFLFCIYSFLAYNVPFSIVYDWLVVENKSLKTYLYEVFIKPFKS